MERLLDSSSYKEAHRPDMIRWGEERRDKDPAYFCQLAVAEADKPVWLVCDARRPSDMTFFTTHYSTVTVSTYTAAHHHSTAVCVCDQVKVVASEGVRRERGWEWRAGVDDAPSECALDNYHCQLLLSNNGDENMLTRQLEHMRDLALSKLKH